MAPRELHDEQSTEYGVRWILTETERESIASILDIDKSVLEGMEGNVMNRSRATCSGCGKRSGLDDMVHNANQLGVHDKQFMVDVLVNGPKALSPAHAMDCSECGGTFDGLFHWEGYWGN
ncbi:hypothetical protein H072_3582 [Dactylellina haptotyla CBS 200.50]|uniref:RBP protein n=1 Tax=Dactylellina haptotyla (strain CBS 200.50) TaxID=1284197 RepID=S8AHX6_DACHA|nr:hypothetical protein H072_3582 [Dactylellina haptotyla CBS 200.50]